PAWVVLALPDFGVSTAEAFAWFDADRGSRRSSFDKLRMSATLDTLALSMSKGELRNDLQKPVAKRHPVIARIVTVLRRAGAAHAAMSGSGSAVFGLFAGKSDATRAARAISA